MHTTSLQHQIRLLYMWVYVLGLCLSHKHMHTQSLINTVSSLTSLLPAFRPLVIYLDNILELSNMYTVKIQIVNPAVSRLLIMIFVLLYFYDFLVVFECHL